jgi:serine/threonine protein kinase
VDENFNIKVADFGLSRVATAGKEYYRMLNSKLLPVKWMAPESLKYGVFTTFSDVVSAWIKQIHICMFSRYFHLQWSFGVTLWEVLSLGESPFPGVNNRDVLEYLENGDRMRRPKDCPDEL